jgi:uncharacterized protein (TIGR00252 family)
MSTTETGRTAEDLVADELKKHGFKILSQNWRTRWCEIDIVARRKSTVYLVEVKYRKSESWGDGLDAITPRKLKQMEFAAELWVGDNNWTGDIELMAASVSGRPPKVDQIIEI